MSTSPRPDVSVLDGSEVHPEKMAQIGALRQDIKVRQRHGTTAMSVAFLAQPIAREAKTSSQPHPHDVYLWSEGYPLPVRAVPDFVAAAATGLPDLAGRDLATQMASSLRGSKGLEEHFAQVSDARSLAGAVAHMQSTLGTCEAAKTAALDKLDGSILRLPKLEAQLVEAQQTLRATEKDLAAREEKLLTLQSDPSISAERLGKSKENLEVVRKNFKTAEKNVEVCKEAIETCKSNIEVCRNNLKIKEIGLSRAEQNQSDITNLRQALGQLGQPGSVAVPLALSVPGHASGVVLGYEPSQGDSARGQLRIEVVTGVSSVLRTRIDWPPAGGNTEAVIDSALSTLCAARQPNDPLFQRTDGTPLSTSARVENLANAFATALNSGQMAAVEQVGVQRGSERQLHQTVGNCYVWNPAETIARAIAQSPEARGGGHAAADAFGACIAQHAARTIETSTALPEVLAGLGLGLETQQELAAVANRQADTVWRPMAAAEPAAQSAAATSTTTAAEIRRRSSFRGHLPGQAPAVEVQSAAASGMVQAMPPKGRGADLKVEDITDVDHTLAPSGSAAAATIPTAKAPGVDSGAPVVADSARAKAVRPESPVVTARPASAATAPLSAQVVASTSATVLPAVSSGVPARADQAPARAVTPRSSVIAATPVSPAPAPVQPLPGARADSRAVADAPVYGPFVTQVNPGDDPALKQYEAAASVTSRGSVGPASTPRSSVGMGDSIHTLAAAAPAVPPTSPSTPPPPIALSAALLPPVLSDPSPSSSTDALPRPRPVASSTPLSLPTVRRQRTKQPASTPGSDASSRDVSPTPSTTRSISSADSTRTMPSFAPPAPTLAPSAVSATSTPRSLETPSKHVLPTPPAAQSASSLDSTKPVPQIAPLDTVSMGGNAAVGPIPGSLRSALEAALRERGLLGPDQQLACRLASHRPGSNLRAGPYLMMDPASRSPAARAVIEEVMRDLGVVVQPAGAHARSEALSGSTASVGTSAAPPPAPGSSASLAAADRLPSVKPLPSTAPPPPVLGQGGAGLSKVPVLPLTPPPPPPRIGVGPRAGPIAA